MPAVVPRSISADCTIGRAGTNGCATSTSTVDEQLLGASGRGHGYQAQDLPDQATAVGLEELLR